MSRTLDEVSVWLVGSERLRYALGTVCHVEPLEPGDWRQHLAERSADFLLVEGTERFDNSWLGEISELLKACEGAGVTRMLWITSSPFDPSCLMHGERYSRGFAAGVTQLRLLLEAGFRDPSLLWNATALPVDDRPVPETAARPNPVVWLADWREESSPAWRERLLSILRPSAEWGLSIIGLDDPDLLPPDLRRHVRPAASRQDALERARVVVAADPTMATGDLVPSVLFDAIACGAAVISPTAVGSIWDFCAGGTQGVAPRDLILAARDSKSAELELHRLLSDDVLREQTVHACRRVVAYNHTYANRLATLASAAGLPLIPNAPDYTTHS